MTNDQALEKALKIYGPKALVRVETDMGDFLVYKVIRNNFWFSDVLGEGLTWELAFKRAGSKFKGCC